MTIRSSCDILLTDDMLTKSKVMDLFVWVVIVLSFKNAKLITTTNAKEREMKLRIITLSLTLFAGYTYADTVTDACFNCPPLSTIANADTFDDSIYYAGAISAVNGSLSAETIKQEITLAISQNHKNLSYSEVWTALTRTDQDPANTANVNLLYKGISIPKFSNGSGSQSTNPDNWNREHVWAKSHGFPSSSLEGYTDIHHLRPTDISINSSRGNLDFDNSDAPLAEAPANRVDGDSFEPRDAVKGDVARMLFYMDTRYEGFDATPDLQLVDRITNVGEAALGRLCRLIEWHNSDPVDATEVYRNNSIYEFQGNRNPFIDHPEWVDILYSADTCSTDGGGGDTGGGGGGGDTGGGGGDTGGGSPNGAALFISEYVEGSSYNKAIELFNPSSSDIDLEVDNYQLARFSNGSTSPSNINLTGVVAANSTFVIAEPRAAAEILAVADFLSGSLSHNGDDAYVLYKDGVVVDSFGRVGEDPGSAWGSDTSTTKDNTLRRLASVQSGNTVFDAEFDPANEWQGVGKDVFDDLGLHTFTPAEVFISEYIEGSSYNKALELFNPSAADIDLAAEGYQLERFSNGSVSGVLIDLSGILAAGDVFVIAEPRANSDILAQADQLSGNLSHNGDDAYVLYKNGEIIDSFGRVGEDPGSQWGSSDNKTKDNTLVRQASVNAGDVVIDDAFDPALEWQGLGKDNTSSLGSHTVNDGQPPVADIGQCFDAATLISAVQGSEFSSPLIDEIHIVEGIVSATLPDSNGFFLQEEQADQDNDPMTSEGIFVSLSGADLPAEGDVVRLQGSVEENYGKTQLVANQALLICGAGSIAATLVTLPFTSAAHQESLEGMLVAISTELTVTDNYNLGRYGEVTLSNGRIYVPTNLYLPGSVELTELAATNSLNKVTLDDGVGGQNPDDIIFPTGGLTAFNTLRLGDKVTELTGVLDYSYGKYRITPTTAPNFIHENERNEFPQLAEQGNLRVASFNLLNYFNGDGLGAGFPTSRGADTAEEFTRQRDKVMSAITNLNADIIGLLEMENDGFGENSAIQDLVNGLNAQAPADVHYSFVNPGIEALGGDQIKVAMIYNDLAVSEIGTAAYLLEFPFEYHNRPPMTQSFRATETGEKLTISVNHFRSKGCSSSGGVENEDKLDGQGCYNLRRVQAAEALSAWLATHPTGVVDEDVLIIGDLNAYNREDPVTSLQTAGFVNLAPDRLGNTAYSYAYGGEIGSLDHILASASLNSKVVAVSEWHINADEPSILDYNTEYKTADKLTSLYSDGPFRASDHDPVIVEINGVTPMISVSETFEGLNTRPRWKLFKFTVPENAVSFTASITGGTGNADLYARNGRIPFPWVSSCAPKLAGNEEVCEFENPKSGTWYIWLRAKRQYSDVTLKLEALYPDPL